MNVRPLDWDSQALGLPVARLDVAAGESEGELATTLTGQGEQGTGLLYVVSDMPLAAPLVGRFNGLLVDRKTTYGRTLEAIPVCTGSAKPYRDEADLAALESLALQSGEHSRFRVDPHMPATMYAHLYWTWLRKSLSGELADQTLLVQADGRPAGFVTLRARDGIGEIGLIAVDAACRGRGIGGRLMDSAFAWFQAHQALTLRVVTQGDNLAACRFYEKSGYARIRLEYYYHFWLQARGHRD